MSIINLERDMVWPQAAAAVVPASTTYPSAVQNVPASGTVAQRVNSFETGFFATTTSTDTLAAGCLILPPAEGDVTPYRFVASITSTVPNAYFAYGWWDANTIRQRRIIAAGKSCNAVVAIPPLDSADPDFGRPLCFYCGVIGGVAGFGMMTGSVQRLISKPPQFATAVS